MSTPRKTTSPRELLVPYIAWLRDHCRGMAPQQPSAGETRISFGQRTLTLDPWAIERLQESLAEEAAPAEHCVLLTEIVALLLKCMADGERFAAASTDKVAQYYRLQAELMLDSNLGNSLVGRTQREVDSLVQRGMTEEARQLSDVMHKLRRSLVGVNCSAGAKVDTPSVEMPSVEALFVEDAGHTIPSPDQAIEGAADLTEDAETFSRHEPPVTGAGRTRFLAGVLALALGLWFAAVELPRLFGSHPRQLRFSDLQTPAVELLLHSRWPGLYVEVRSEAWNTLDPEEQKRLVGDLVEHASQREFTSILVRTVDGRSLVQWWPGRDVRWIDGEDSVAEGTRTADAIATDLPAS